MAKKKQTSTPRRSSRFEGYDGDKRWEVSHPAHPTVKVTAPDKESAIYTAAGLWRTDWTRITCYAYAKARMIKGGSGA